MTNRKSLPIGLFVLLFFSFLPISLSSAQPIAPPDTKIPNFDCYRDAASIVAKMQLLAESYPSLNNLIEIGESVGEQPIYAFEIGNEEIANKPHFFLLAGLHGNDFSQPEVSLRFAEMLLAGYETNADLRWIVDNVEIDLILLANPDGRLEAEAQAETLPEPKDVDYITNKNNVNLEQNFCFQIEDASESCNSFPFEPETQAVIDYLDLKLGDPVPNQSPQTDSQNLFIYFSSHNKETPPPNLASNYQGKLRIPKFYPPMLPPPTDTVLIQLQELTEMLRIFDPNPMFNIETFRTEGLPLPNYPVDYGYFSHGMASIELSAPPKDDSRPMGCNLFTSEHIRNYTNLLVKAAKSAVRPYKIGYGPIVDAITKTELTETKVKFHATISEKNQVPDQPVPNPITSVRYYIDQSTGTVFQELDGWEKDDINPYVSAIDFEIPIESLSPGVHILTLQACSQDEFDIPNEVCGLPFSAFLNGPNPPGTGSKLYLPLIRH